MAKQKTLNYAESFMFPDIPWQKYPVYAVTESGKVVNFKAIAYPTPKSRKKFTRRKQLLFRSVQAKIFDALIGIGYWNPLPVIPEFPVVIQNSYRLPGQSGLFYYLDYYFPTLGLAIELDSDLHSLDKDEVRDKYLLDVLGIKTFRMSGLEKLTTQRGKFQELLALIRGLNPTENPKVFAFGAEILKTKGI